MSVAKFCSECGTPTEGAKFCPECGTPTSAAASNASLPAPPSADEGSPVEQEETVVWEGSPDPVLSPVAARTTKYTITTERLRFSSGMLGKKSESLELFRVKDVNVKRSIKQRARGRGDLTITSTDSTTPSFTLESIQDPESVAETIRSLAREARQRSGVRTQEFI